LFFYHIRKIGENQKYVPYILMWLILYVPLS
jgi:hypothetical protein